RLDDLFEHEGATALVSSAECGAALVALMVAGERGIHRRVVPPFGRAEVRKTSVTDPPRGRGPPYHPHLAQLDQTNDCVTLAGLRQGSEDYIAANRVILRDAIALASQTDVQAMAVLVWEGAPRGSDDVTPAFAVEAQRLGLLVTSVRTL